MVPFLSSRWFSVLLYGMVAGLFLACIVAFRADLAKISADAVFAASGALVLTAALSLLNYLLRAWRWRFLFARLGYRLPLRYAGLTYIAGFAFTLSPGKVGELVRAAYYRRRGIPLAAVTAVFFVERLTDLAVMVSLAAVFLAAGAGRFAPLLWGAGLCVPVFMLVLSMIRAGQLDRIDLYWQARPGRLARLIHLALHAISSAKVLIAPGPTMVALLLGMVAWGAEGVGLHVLGALAPGVVISVDEAVGIYAIAIVVGALSFLPGGLGTAEAVMVALLAHHGYTLADALLITLACRILTLWLAIGLGWLAVAILKLQGESVTQ
jgi:uncharacterized protein (TIRG00374 family)